MSGQLIMFDKQFDSKEEAMFYSYVKELVYNKWAKSFYYQPESFTLSEDVFVHAYEETAKDTKMVKVKLTRGNVYTADFKIVWDKKAKGVFCWLEGGVYKKGFFPYSKQRKDNFIPFFARFEDEELVTYVDVKGSFSNAHGLSTFSNQQKWLMSKGTFVQKIVITLDDKGLFSKTFTPRTVVANEVYQRDCKYGKEGESKLKYEPKLIEQWTKLKK